MRLGNGFVFFKMLELEKNGYNLLCWFFILIWGFCDVINVLCDKMILFCFIYENYLFVCYNLLLLS